MEKKKGHHTGLSYTRKQTRAFLRWARRAMKLFYWLNLCCRSTSCPAAAFIVQLQLQSSCSNVTWSTITAWKRFHCGSSAWLQFSFCALFGRLTVNHGAVFQLALLWRRQPNGDTGFRIKPGSPSSVWHFPWLTQPLIRVTTSREVHEQIESLHVQMWAAGVLHGEEQCCKTYGCSKTYGCKPLLGYPCYQLWATGTQ